MPPYARVATLALTVTTFAAACGSGASADNAEPTTYASGLTHVAALAFDDDGRLWASTAGYDDTGDDAVYVIAHEGAAAVAVITDAHSPLGLVWHEDSLYVASTDGVTAYAGFDGTHFATQDTILTFPEGIGLPGNLAVDSNGRFLLGISAPCDSCDPDSQFSAAVIAFDADGSDLDIYASGIRAPVGLTFFPGTDDLFVTMNQRDDLGDETPGDWLAVVREGQSWGFPGDSELEPVAELDRHGAVAGVAIVGMTAYVAEWATGDLKAVALTQDGSDYTGSVSTFRTGLGNPVPVVATGDGTLLVGDWGTGTIYAVAAN